jgi:DNA-binding GntR family transcriptional regulator
MRDIIYDHLRKAIVCGDIVADTTFSDSEITEEFGVSRTPVREALQKLESAGYIERIPMKGNKVCGLSAWELAHTFAIRKALETLAVRYAAVRIEDVELAALESTLQTIDKARAISEGEKLLEELFPLIKRYNEIAFGACKSTRLIELVWAQREIFDRYRVMRLVLPNRVERSVSRRKLLFEAFQHHDPDAAFEVWSEHLDESFEIWRKKSGFAEELKDFRFF